MLIEILWKSSENNKVCETVDWTDFHPITFSVFSMILTVWEGT